MRKTLTLMLLILTASPLAACKMFWERDEKPAAVATTTESTPTATDTDLAKADTTEAAKPMTPVAPEPTTPVPAKK